MNPDTKEQIRRLKEAFRDEPLDPELLPYVETGGDMPTLRHPLVYAVPYFGGPENGWCNRQLKAKRERIADLEAAGRFDSIIALYERPYRLDAIRTYAERMTDTAYWRAVGWVWTDTEFPGGRLKEWVAILTAKRPGREAMMDDDDRAILASLPEIVTVYRGQSLGHPHGLSWTTSDEMAAWFARRFDRGGIVIAGTVAKADILAYHSGRGEAEVVALPKHITIIKHNHRKGARP